VLIMTENSLLQKVAELAEERASILADLESCTTELKQSVRAAIESGQLTELGAHKLTGVSRNSIRFWMGKT
jgi:hypothetical protein